MSLAFTTADDSFEIRWVLYAMLRDCVQHHLEGGAPGPQFEALHNVQQAVAGASVEVPAGKLSAEMAVIDSELLSLPVSQLAITAQTRSILYLRWPEVGGPASEVVGPLPIFDELAQGAQTLRDVFGPTVSALRALAAKAGASGCVLVSDN